MTVASLCYGTTQFCARNISRSRSLFYSSFIFQTYVCTIVRVCVLYYARKLTDTSNDHNALCTLQTSHIRSACAESQLCQYFKVIRHSQVANYGILLFFHIRNLT